MCTLYTYKLMGLGGQAPPGASNSSSGTNYPPTEVFPDYEAPVIVNRADGAREVRMMRFGFRSFRASAACGSTFVIRSPRRGRASSRWGCAVLYLRMPSVSIRTAPRPSPSGWFAQT